MQEANFFISGKVLLACALLLKIKSNKLVNEEISNFDSQLFKQEETFEELEELFENAPHPEYEKPRLTIKTPMPRKRKVTLQDLMNALHKALEVEKRRNVKRDIFNRVDVKIPENKIDISELITSIYNKIIDFFKANKKEKLESQRKIKRNNNDKANIENTSECHRECSEKSRREIVYESFGSLKQFWKRKFSREIFYDIFCS